MRPRAGGRAGYSLIEVTVSMFVLMVVSIGATTLLLRNASLSEVTSEDRRAVLAAEELVEVLRSLPRGEVFQRYNGTNVDDPPAGPSPGPGFDVAGLGAQAADADGRVGEVAFPGDGIVLREDLADPRLGMPRDLNGDGAIDADDHAADHLLLPVRVRIAWTGRGGDRQLEVHTSL
jgi:hypothetical protein